MWYEILLPIVAQIAGIVFAIVVSLVAVWLKKRFNIEIEQKDRDALHSAIITGLNLAVARRGSIVGTITGAVVGEVSDYVKRSVPDATRRLKVNKRPALLQDLIVAKSQQVLGKTAPVVSPPAG